MAIFRGPIEIVQPYGDGNTSVLVRGLNSNSVLFTGSTGTVESMNNSGDSKWVIILSTPSSSHGYITRYFYMNLSSVTVTEGMSVSSGTAIGTQTSGYGCRVQVVTSGEIVNPIRYIGFSEGLRNVKGFFAQQALFPMTHMYISQGPGGDTSHNGTNENAYDIIGAIGNWGTNPVREPAYAPFDSKVVWIEDSCNGIFIESAFPVLSPSFPLGYMWMQLLHANTIPEITTDAYNSGTIIKQGDHFYNEGNAGCSQVHIHVEVGTGKNPWYSGLSGWDSYFHGFTNYMEQCLFLPKSVGVTTSAGYVFTKTDKTLFTGSYMQYNPNTGMQIDSGDEGTDPTNPEDTTALQNQVNALAAQHSAYSVQLNTAVAERDAQYALKLKKEAEEQAEYVRLRATEGPVNTLIAVTTADMNNVETEMTELFGL